MVTILNVSWQRFLLVEQPNVQIGELALHCQQFAPRLFVFHDPGGQWSALVLPGEVLEHIAAQGLAYDQPVRGSSLYGLLQEGLLMVDVHRPAEEVAAHALTVGADTVLVLDSGGVPVGLFLPGWVQHQLPRVGVINPSVAPRTYMAVQRMGRLDDLPAVFDAATNDGLDLHSELLNLDTAEAYICSGVAGGHKRQSCPCQYHPSASCGRLQVAQQ